MKARLEQLLRISRTQTNWRTEILAGCTTFITMAYIIFVNPSILHETGMPLAAVTAATCLCAAIGQHSDGRARALSDRAGARHGAERLLHLHGGEGHGRAMADRAGRGVSLRRRLSDSDCRGRAADDRGGDSARAVRGGRGRHWAVHRVHRAAQCRDHRRQTGDAGDPGQSAEARIRCWRSSGCC